MNNKSRKPAFIWLSSAHFINDVYTGVLSPIMPFIAAKLAISMAFATLILTVSHVFSSLVQPVFGFFADNINRRVFIFNGLLLTALFISIAPAIPNPYLMLLAIIVGNIGSSLFHPQSLGLASKFAPDGAGKSMGIFMSMGALGYSAGPIFSSWITQFLGLEAMPVMAIPGVICALLMFKFVPKISLTEKPPRINFKKALSDILSNRKLNILNFIAMLKNAVASSSTILLPFLWKDLGYSPLRIGIVIFAFLCAGAMGSLVSRHAEKFAGIKTILYISMVLPLPLMVVFALCYKALPVLSFAIFVVMGFVTSMAMPATMVMAQKELPEYKSIISGFINGFSWGIVAVFVSATGFVAQKFGIINVLAAITVVPALCSALIEKLFSPALHGRS